MADANQKLTVTAEMKDKVSKGLDKMGKSGKDAGQSIAWGFIKAQVALGALKAGFKLVGNFLRDITTGAADTGDQIEKMSRRLGIGTEVLSAWGYAAELSGTSIEAVAKGLQMISKNAFDASRGMGEGKIAFEALGIAVKDASGRLRSGESLFLEFADKTSRLADENTKAGLAMKAFGEAGVALLPMLEEGSAGIEKMIAEARRMGITWIEEEAKRAAAFKDAQTKFEASIRGIKKTIAVALFPALRMGLDKLAEYIASNRETVAGFAIDIATTLGGAAFSIGGAFVDAAQFVVEAIQTMRDAWKSAKDYILLESPVKMDQKYQDLVSGKFIKHLDLGDTDAKLQGAIDRLGRLSAGIAGARAEFIRLMEAGKKGVGSATEGSAVDLEFLDERAVAAFEAQWEALRQRLAPRMQWREILGEAALAGPMTGEGPSFLERVGIHVEEMSAVADASSVVVDAIRGVGEAIEALPPPTEWERLVAGIKGAADRLSEVYSDAETGASALNAVHGAFSSFFETIMSGSASAGDAFKALAMDIIRSLQQILAQRLAAQLIGGMFGEGGLIPMASGGIVTRPTAALIGEAGPEAVIPLRSAKGLGGGTVQQEITVNVFPAPGMDEEALAGKVVSKLRASRGFRQEMRRSLGGAL